jgi:hypothetical protein
MLGVTVPWETLVTVAGRGVRWSARICADLQQRSTPSRSCLNLRTPQPQPPDLTASLQEVIVTNTIPTAPENVFPSLTILSVANLLGETIWRVYNSASVQALRE